jgi:c(7)-type cytochrome triheme protein
MASGVKKSWLPVACLVAVLAFFAPAGLSQFFDLPPLPEPWQYGNVLIDRQTGKTQFPPVSFSHWSHRRHFTCRVCHFELEFAMQTNATEITEADNLEGRFCGACHDGQTAFGHTLEHCSYCHNYGFDGSRDRFLEMQEMPYAPYGNMVDWVEALERGQISPRQTIYDEEYEPIEYTEQLDLPADWALIPGASFSHEKHQQWLDCADCHPDIFNVKKKTTERFDMRYNLKGKFCGACHLSVAFPMDNCKRCHPKMSTGHIPGE